MALSPEEKEAKKKEIKAKVQEHKDRVFGLIRMACDDPKMLGYSGYSGTFEEGIKKLMKAHDKECMRLMRPFDNGDLD